MLLKNYLYDIEYETEGIHTGRIIKKTKEKTIEVLKGIKEQTKKDFKNEN